MQKTWKTYMCEKLSPVKILNQIASPVRITSFSVNKYILTTKTMFQITNHT